MESTTQNCAVGFCTRSKSNLTKDAIYCNFHNRNYERTGDPLNTDFDNPVSVCTIDGCTRSHLRRGLCSSHYYRLRRTGSPLPKKKATKCSVEGCLRQPPYTKGLCSAHYQRMLSKGDTGTAEISTREIKTCAVPHCLKNGGLESSILCRSHRQMANSYSLSEDKYVQMMSAPCYICGDTDTPNIDHDHKCCPDRQSCGACVRGTLCARCNKVLGSVVDSVDLLKQMVLYLS